MYIKRAAEETVLRISQSFPVLLVSGPRQVGKTTMLKRLAEEKRAYVTLDDPDARYLAKSDPALFLQRFTPPVLIDEIQYAPELLPYIKIRVDAERTPGLFWLTGSQAFHLMKNVSESLAGRVGIITLLGLSTAELMEKPTQAFTLAPERLQQRTRQMQAMDIHEIFQRIFRGSLPEVATRPDMDWEMYYASYVNTYLQRDIHSLTQVGDEMAFYNFMTVIAARTAKPVIYEEIARDAGISAPTAKQWLSILVSSHIVSLVQPYYHNILKRVTKMPVLHFLDMGLCAYLLKWTSPEVLEKGAMGGPFFESYVYSEIYKSYANLGKIPPLYYYRDKDQREIDIILVQDGTIHPIEVKKAVSPGKDALRHFAVLKPLATEATGAHQMVIGLGAVICMAPDTLPLDRQTWMVPAWSI